MPAAASRPLTRTALVLALGLGLAACGDDVDPTPSAEAPRTVRPSLPSVADGVTQQGVPKLVNVGLQDGRVTGAVGPVTLRKDTPVRLTALTDTADTLLVKGYDLRSQLTVGQPVQLAFIADRVGRFEVVLEESGTVLTVLDVQ